MSFKAFFCYMVAQIFSSTVIDTRNGQTIYFSTNEADTNNTSHLYDEYPYLQGRLSAAASPKHNLNENYFQYLNNNVLYDEMWDNIGQYNNDTSKTPSQNDITQKNNEEVVLYKWEEIDINDHKMLGSLFPILDDIDINNEDSGGSNSVANEENQPDVDEVPLFEIYNLICTEKFIDPVPSSSNPRKRKISEPLQDNNGNSNGDVSQKRQKTSELPETNDISFYEEQNLDNYGHDESQKRQKTPEISVTNDISFDNEQNLDNYGHDESQKRQKTPELCETNDISFDDEQNLGRIALNILEEDYERQINQEILYSNHSEKRNISTTCHTPGFCKQIKIEPMIKDINDTFIKHKEVTKIIIRIIKNIYLFYYQNTVTMNLKSYLENETSPMRLNKLLHKIISINQELKFTLCVFKQRNYISALDLKINHIVKDIIDRDMMHIDLDIFFITTSLESKTLNDLMVCLFEDLSYVNVDLGEIKSMILTIFHDYSRAIDDTETEERFLSLLKNIILTLKLLNSPLWSYSKYSKSVVANYFSGIISKHLSQYFGKDPDSYIEGVNRNKKKLFKKIKKYENREMILELKNLLFIHHFINEDNFDIFSSCAKMEVNINNNPVLLTYTSESKFNYFMKSFEKLYALADILLTNIYITEDIVE